MYDCRWITDDMHIIGDEEYGHNLLKITICDGLKDELSELEIENFLKEITDSLNRKIVRQEDNK